MILMESIWQERTLNSLLEHGIQTELNGGDIPAVPISALMVNKEKRFFNIEAKGLFWLFFCRLLALSLIISFVYTR